MHVRFDQPGVQDVVTQLDGPGEGAHVLLELRHGPDADDVAVLDSHRTGVGPPIVHSHHAADEEMVGMRVAPLGRRLFGRPDGLLDGTSGVQQLAHRRVGNASLVNRRNHGPPPVMAEWHSIRLTVRTLHVAGAWQ